jgi:hypothetical protein
MEEGEEKERKTKGEMAGSRRFFSGTRSILLAVPQVSAVRHN